MKRFFLSIIFLSLFLTVRAQTDASPTIRFKKIEIDDSECIVYMPGEGELSRSYSPDSSIVYTYETTVDYKGELAFGIILVRLNDVNILGQEEDMLINYMDYLKQPLSINYSVGYGKGHVLNTHPTSKGVLDYWEDTNGNKLVVKGWAAESTLAVMYILGADYPDVSIQEAYFNGFRFPGD